MLLNARDESNSPDLRTYISTYLVGYNTPAVLVRPEGSERGGATTMKGNKFIVSLCTHIIQGDSLSSPNFFSSTVIQNLSFGTFKYT